MSKGQMSELTRQKLREANVFNAKVASLVDAEAIRVSDQIFEKVEEFIKPLDMGEQQATQVKQLICGRVASSVWWNFHQVIASKSIDDHNKGEDAKKRV